MDPRWAPFETWNAVPSFEMEAVRHDLTDLSSMQGWRENRELNPTQLHRSIATKPIHAHLFCFPRHAPLRNFPDCCAAPPEDLVCFLGCHAATPPLPPPEYLAWFFGCRTEVPLPLLPPTTWLPSHHPPPRKYILFSCAAVPLSPRPELGCRATASPFRTYFFVAARRSHHLPQPRSWSRRCGRTLPPLLWRFVKACALEAYWKPLCR